MHPHGNQPGQRNPSTIARLKAQRGFLVAAENNLPDLVVEGIGLSQANICCKSHGKGIVTGQVPLTHGVCYQLSASGGDCSESGSGFCERSSPSFGATSAQKVPSQVNNWSSPSGVMRHAPSKRSGPKA